VLGRKTLDLLQRWRAAERHWEATSPKDPAAGEAARQVVARWLAYQEAMTEDPQELILVADGQGRYVAASANASELLGYSSDELAGRSVTDLTAPQLLHGEAQLWDDFLRAGRQEGHYRLRRRDGTLVAVAYRARAHHPIPGLYVSRLRPTTGFDPAS